MTILKDIHRPEGFFHRDSGKDILPQKGDAKSEESRRQSPAPRTGIAYEAVKGQARYRPWSGWTWPKEATSASTSGKSLQLRNRARRARPPEAPCSDEPSPCHSPGQTGMDSSPRRQQAVSSRMRPSLLRFCLMIRPASSEFSNLQHARNYLRSYIHSGKPAE